MKKILASLLAVCMVLAMVPFSFAEGEYVAKIGDETFTTLSDALTAANSMTGDVTVEIYGEAEFNDGMALNGAYTSIAFVGKADSAKITVNKSAAWAQYVECSKAVTFTDLILDKANLGWAANSGHMGNYFSIQGGEVTYTNCKFLNGACANTGTAVFNGCTFEHTAGEYGLWVYDDALVTVNGGTVDSAKGIKVYSEGEESVTSTLTVQNATFTENVTAKPAVAIGYAASVSLIGNTYNNSTAHIELDSGSDADCNGIPLVVEDADGNDITSSLKMTDRSNSNNPCGVVVDGEVYTTITKAAEEVGGTASKVTLLYSTEETVELPAGATLVLGEEVQADNVTVPTPVATIGTQNFSTLQAALDAAQNGDVVILLADDLAEDVTVVQKENVKFTIDGANKTFKGTITVDGRSQAYATAGVTIRNFNFDATAITKDACVRLGDGTNATRYTNNVTVESCTFTDNDRSAAGIKSYTGGCKNLTVTGCTATGMHSLMQLYPTTGVEISGCTVTDCKNGISLRSSENVTVTDTQITAVGTDGYGIRADGNNKGSLVIGDGVEITAWLPILVRNADAGTGTNTNASYDLEISGDGVSMTATGNYGCIVASKADVDGNNAPVEPTGTTNIQVSAGSYSAAIKPEWITDDYSGTQIGDRFVVGEYYTITFETNDGSPIASERFVEGTVLVLRVDSADKKYIPTREGYTFDGWYSKENLDPNSLIGSITVSGDETVYAKWTEIPKSYTVKFQNGGAVFHEETVLSGAKVTKPADPTRDGYKFLGWDTDSANQNALDEEYNFEQPVTKKLTLYAKWAPIYTVKFQNGGVIFAEEKVLSGEKVAAPIPAPTRDGYKFLGWDTDSKNPNQLDKEYDFEKPVTKNTTLFAKWTPLYTVTFNYYEGKSEQVTVLSGETVTVPSPAPTREGYTFIGWDTKGENINQLIEAYDFDTAVTQNLTLYAKWTKNPVYCTITFETNGGSRIDPERFVEGTVLVLRVDSADKKYIPTREGYTFDGWYTQSDKYIGSLTVSGDETVYAKWTEIPKSYTVTFESNGGSAIAPVTVTAGTVLNLDVIDIDTNTYKYRPTRVGYAFDGWYENEDGTGTQYTKFTVNSNLTLYAKWFVTYGGIHYNANGGSGTMRSKGGAAGLLIDENGFTAPEGYGFAGWNTAADGSGTSYQPGDRITVPGGSDVTLYAQWTENSISEEPADTDTVDYQQLLMLLALMNSQKYDVEATVGAGATLTTDGAAQIKFNKSQDYTIELEDGYVVTDVIVNGKSIGAVTEFTLKNVRKDQKVEIVTERVNPYADLAGEAAYYDIVLDLYYRGIMNGDGVNFGAEETLTRAQLVTVLWRAAGEPSIYTDMDFEDVAEDAYYAPAVAWAYELGIMEGDGVKNFYVDDNITVEELCTVIYRWVKLNGGGYEDDSWKNADYADIKDVSDWALEAVVYFAENEILPVADGKLNPNADALRWLIAVMVYPMIAA